MNLYLSNTSKIVHVNGVPARIWQGQTTSGITVVAYITWLQVSEDESPDRLAEFERELQETPAPHGAEVEAIPLRMILYVHPPDVFQKTCSGQLFIPGREEEWFRGDDPQEIANQITARARELWAEAGWFERTEE